MPGAILAHSKQRVVVKSWAKSFECLHARLTRSYYALPGIQIVRRSLGYIAASGAPAMRTSQN